MTKFQAAHLLTGSVKLLSIFSRNILSYTNPVFPKVKTLPQTTTNTFDIIGKSLQEARGQTAANGFFTRKAARIENGLEIWTTLSIGLPLLAKTIRSIRPHGLSPSICGSEKGFHGRSLRTRGVASGYFQLEPLLTKEAPAFSSTILVT